MYLLCLFNPGNTKLIAQQTSSIEIAVTNHETLLEYWRPDVNDDLTFEIQVTVPTDFSSGKLVATLQNVTTYSGISGNVPIQGANTEPDLKLSQTTGWSQDGNALTHNLNANAEQTVYLHVDCRDYAAYGELQLTASSSSSRYTSNTVVIKIPKDTNGNKIADCWQNDASMTYDQNADNDEGININHPVFNNPDWSESNRDLSVLNGDGISVLDEYRGLNVGGSWTDTDPNGWDVFILSDVGIGDACYLPSMTIRQMGNDEIFHGDSNVDGDVDDMSGGIVYHNQIREPIISYSYAPNNDSSEPNNDSSEPNNEPITITKQSNPVVYAIRLSEDTDASSDSIIGEMGPGPPSASTKGVIFTERIKDSVYEYNMDSNVTITVLEQESIDSVIAHEIGHGVSLPHCPDRDHPNCYMWDTYDWTIQKVNQYHTHHDIDYDLSNPGFRKQSVAPMEIRNRQYSDVFGIYLTLLEDVNGDNAVNILDLVIVTSNFGDVDEDNPNRVGSDFDRNGTVDIEDLIMIAVAFGNTPVVLTELPEDVNNDGIVDRSDLEFVASHFSTTGTHTADVNRDCVVNISDIELIASNI